MSWRKRGCYSGGWQGVADLDQLQDTMAKNAMRQRMLFEQELQGLEAAFEKEREELMKQCRCELPYIIPASAKCCN